MNDTYKYTSRFEMLQETPEGPVMLNLTMNPTVSKHTLAQPICYDLMASMYTAAQVNLIQEGFELARSMDNPKYKVSFEMGQDDMEGEVFSKMEIDPVDLDTDIPISYMLISSLILQLLEHVGVVDEEGNPTESYLDSLLQDNGTIH